MAKKGKTLREKIIEIIDWILNDEIKIVNREEVADQILELVGKEFGEIQKSMLKVCDMRVKSAFKKGKETRVEGKIKSKEEVNLTKDGTSFIK